MLRNIDLDEISDGKLYTAGDLAKVGCQDCEGCCDCCCQMGDTIILDPLDVWQLMQGRGKSFEQLLDESLDLHVQDAAASIRSARAFAGCFRWDVFMKTGAFDIFYRQKSAAGKTAQSRKSANGSICRNLVVMRRLWRTGIFLCVGCRIA